MKKSKNSVQKIKPESKGDWFTWRPQMPIVFVNWKRKEVGIYYSIGTKDGNHPKQMKVKGLDS